MVGGGEVGNRLLTIGLDERRQRAPRFVVQDDAFDGHTAVGSGFSMFRFSISPTVPPLIGRIRLSVNARVSGTKIADMIQTGGCCPRSTMNKSGMTRWPTI